MHNSDPKSLYDLSAEQVVIGITLQNEDFRSSVVNYILGLGSIDQLNQEFHSTFRDIQTMEMRESFTNVVTSIFTQKRSFFYILSKVVQVINEARPQIGRDDIQRYLSIYEEVMTEQGEQFRYIGLPISIYENIVKRLDRYLGDEEKLIFSILAGCNPNTLQIQLPQNILSALFDIDKIKVVSLFGNFRLNTSRLVDVLISTAVDQGILFTQISSLLTFFENHGLINRRSNAVNSKSAVNIHLRYIVFRSSVDRRLYDFVNEFMHSQLRLSNKNKYFAFIQAVREARVDILDLIWNFFPFYKRGEIFTYSVNQQFAFYLAAGHTDETVLNWLWNHASSDEKRTEMFNRYDIISFSFAISCGNRSGLEWLWNHAPNDETRDRIFEVIIRDHLNKVKNSDVLEWLLGHVSNNEIRKNIFITSMYELFRRAVTSGNVSELQWLWNHAPSYTARNHMFDNLDEFSGNIQNLDVLEWLLHHVSDDIPRRIFYTSGSNFFSQALVHNDQSELQRLWNIANNPQIRQHMLNNILDRRHSFGLGIINFGTFRWLLEHARDSQKRSVFNTNIFRLFSEAVTSGNVSELQWLWSNSYNNYEMQVKIFGNLVSGQLDQNVVDLDTLKWLWNHAPNDEVRRSIFVANISKLFRRAVASGNVSELQWFWGNASNNEKRQIFIDNIFMAMNSRNVEVLEWFGNKVFDDEMQNAFRTSASEIFTTAASHEDIDGLQWFWDHLSNNVRNEVFRRGITDAFVLNQKLASLDMLKWFWNNTPDNQIQGQIFRRNMNHFFREVIISKNVNGLQWLLNSAPDNQAKSEMLNKGIEFIFLLNQLQSEKGVGLLEWIWNNVSKNEILDMLKEEVNGSFILAIASENVSKLEWFWDNLPSDKVRMEMLKVNEYQPLVDVIRNPNLALFIGKFKSFIDGRLVVNSGSIRAITAQEWVNCFKALEEARENRALNFVRDEIISLLGTKLIKEVNKAYKKSVETEDSSKPQLGSSYENGQKCKRLKKHSKRSVSKVLCMDSRDEEDVTKEEKEQRIKELFDTNKIKQIANNVKFQDQLFKVSEQISKGKVVDQNIEVLVTEIKNIDLSSVDSEIRDIVREIRDNAENEKKIKNVLKGRGVAEKIRKVAEYTGLAFTVFLVGKHIVSGDVEGLSYDALNLWVMPKIGEKISERILALGTKLDSQALKALSLSIRYSISNFAAFLGLEQSIKARHNAQDPVDIKIADLNIATNSIFIAADVPAIVTGTMLLTGMEVGLIGEFTGPFGAVVSVADIIISQFVEAELELEKLEERIRLTGWEKLESYFSNLLDIAKPSNIGLDIFAQGCYSKYIDIKNKDYYDQVTYSLPNILVTTRKYTSCFGFLPCYTKITSLSAELKHNISVNVETRGIAVSPDISRIIPGNVGSFKVICGPLDRDIKEKIITKKEEGGRSLKHSEEVKELSLQEYQKNVANCEGTVVYRKKGVFNPLKLLIFLPNPNAHLYADPRDNLDIYFTGENIISRIPPSAPRNTDYYGTHRYYFPNQVILCNISNSADHFFYITGKKNFHCNIVKADIKQRNTVVTKGNFTDFENIHFVFGSNATNHIEISNAKYVDGKGGSDVITVNNFAKVKSYFGDFIRGNCSVSLPMNFSDIDSITYTDNIMNIYNKGREFVSVGGQKSFKTADSLFVTLTKVDSMTNMAINLHVMKTVDIASNMDNPNFKITKQTSYGSHHVTIGGDGNYIFYPDKENHTFYWEAHDNMKHLYLFIGRDNNFSIGKANGILDFSHSAKKELLPRIIDEGKVQFYDEDRKLRVTLLPNYKNVVVTFDRHKYYRLHGEKLERDYCSHDLKIDGRFYVDVRELLYLYNCFTFSGDKILFIRQGNNLVLVSAKGLLLMLDYYHIYDYWWDFSIRLDNSVIEPEEFKKRADNPSSLRHYHPYREVLRIYHNQPINKRQIGLVDLEGKSILDFNMKIVSDSLVMLYKNDTFVIVENWNNYEPAREMMFAFNEMIVSNAKCLVSNCDPKDIIKDFQKEKRKVGVNIEKYSKKLKEEKTLQRKRRHHHGDHSLHQNHLSRRPLAIDQSKVAASSTTRSSSWINDLFGWVKSSIDGLLGSKTDGTASSVSQVDGQFARASVSNSSSTSTILPSDGTDKKQENGGFFRDDIDYINANLKQMHERQTPVKFNPSGRNRILEMGDHYLSQADFNDTITLLDVLIRKVTGQKYISTLDQSISLLEAQGYALNITKKFERVVEQAGLKSGVLMHRLNIDYMGMQKEITRKIMSGKFTEISEILNSYVEKACPDRKAGYPGKLSSKKFDKFMIEFNKGLDLIVNQSMQQILHNGDCTVNGTEEQQMSFKPQSYLSNASIQGHLTQARDLRLN